ncbi:MAG: tetratricopeptide repeat protein [Pseudomonadota bacterium]
MATLGLTGDQQQAVEEFKRDIVEPSMTKLVILDFWAEWCGPCKALTPVLEKVAADYADKGVVLAKINVDENKFIAGQFQVQSIPTVYAIFQGQPVANLTNARSESQLKGALDELLSKLPIEAGGDGEAQQDIAPLLAMGEEVLAGGDANRAAGIFGQIVEMQPQNDEAVGGLARALLADNRVTEAKAILDALPEDQRQGDAVKRALSALALTEDANADHGDSAALAQQLEREPDNHEVRLDYANVLWGAQNRDGAVEQLLTIIRADKDWNEGAARQRLLQIFEAVGLEDSWVAGARRKLSAALFG